MKKETWLKLICGIMALVMVLSLTACSSKKSDDEDLSVVEIWEDEDGDQSGDSGASGNSDASGGSNSSGTSSNGKTTYKNTADNSEGAKLQPLSNPYGSIPSNVKGTTVKFATWIDHTSNESAQVLKDFTAKTGIKIQLVKVAQSGYMSKMTSMIASGQAPDVFVDNGEWPVSLKIAQPLNSYININDPVWSKSHIKYGTINNKLYLINGENVHWNFVYGVFFNKKIAEANGIKTPYDYRDENNWNWTTMRQYMKDYSSIPGSYYGGYLSVDQLAITAGTSLVKYNNGKFSADTNDKMLSEAIKTYADIKKNEYMMDSPHHVFLKNGTQGLFFGSSWQMTRSAINWREGTVDEYPMNMEDFGFIEYPGPKGGKAYACQCTRAYGICKDAPNPVGAGYFLRYFLDADNYDFNTVYKKPEISKEMITRVKKANDSRTYCIDATQNCMALVNSKLYSTTISEIKETDPAQIISVLSKKSGVCDNAAKKANSLISSLK